MTDSKSGDQAAPQQLPDPPAEIYVPELDPSHPNDKVPIVVRGSHVIVGADGSVRQTNGPDTGPPPGGLVDDGDTVRVPGDGDGADLLDLSASISLEQLTLDAGRDGNRGSKDFFSSRLPGATPNLGQLAEWDSKKPDAEKGDTK